MVVGPPQLDLSSPVLTPARRALYSLGTFGSSLLQQTVLLWVFYFYAPPPGQGLPVRVTPGLLGVALGLGRLVDALADPLVAHWSDRLRGPAGRRRPFILIGAPIMAVAFALIWRPPDPTPTFANFAYVAALLGIFFLVFTLVLNPYTALLPEVTRAGRERVGTAAAQAVFSLAGTAVGYIASGPLASRMGFAAMGLVLAPVGALALIAAGLAVRERPIDDARLDFTRTLHIVFGYRPFRIFIAGFALLWLGLSVIQLALALIVTVLMGLPQTSVGAVLGLSVAASILATPVVVAAGHRIGSHRTLLVAMSVAAVIVPLIGTIGLWPVPISAAVQGYVLIPLAGPALAALFTLPNAILADITQAAARQSGQRVEGMFFAFQGLILNGATSVSSAILGAALSVFGYGLGLRVVPLLAAAFVVAGIAVFRRFPNEETPA
ncbi:MAG: MFS transporter [Armatimonadota bacterium]